KVTIIDDTANADTITPTTSNISGAATFVIPPWHSISLISDGTNWQVVGGNDSNGIGYFPGLTVVSGSTNSTYITLSNTSTGGHNFQIGSGGSSGSTGAFQLLDNTIGDIPLFIYAGTVAGAAKQIGT